MVTSPYVSIVTPLAIVMFYYFASSQTVLLSFIGAVFLPSVAWIVPIPRGASSEVSSATLFFTLVFALQLESAFFLL